MPLVQLLPTVADVEVTHLSPNPARVEATAAADATTARDFGEQRGAPLRQTLRGERPRLAAICA
jgi:hypothetical protein